MIDILPTDVLEMIVKIADREGNFELRRTCKTLNSFECQISRQYGLWCDKTAAFDSFIGEDMQGDVDFTGVVCFQGGARTAVKEFPNAACITVVGSRVTSEDFVGFTGAIVLLRCTLEPEIELGCRSLIMFECEVPEMVNVIGNFPIMLLNSSSLQFPTLVTDCVVQELVQCYSYHDTLDNSLFVKLHGDDDHAGKFELASVYGDSAVAMLICLDLQIRGRTRRWATSGFPKMVEYIDMLMEQTDRAAVIRSNCERVDVMKCDGSERV